MKYRLLVAPLAGILSLGAQAQKASPSTRELVRGAVSEAWELAMELESDGRLPYAKLAAFMALLDGPRGLPAIDAITHRVVQSGTYGQSLRVLKISTLADVVQSLLGPAERTEFLYRSGAYNLRRQSPGTGRRLAELRQWEAMTDDLKPHIQTLLLAVSDKDRVLAPEAAVRANARFAAAVPDLSMALEMVVVLQLRDWIGEEQYGRGIRQLIDKLGVVEWPNVEFFLTTTKGSVELGPAEYYALELLRREKITGQLVGLNRLSDLDRKVVQVGGWDEIHFWYRRDRIKTSGHGGPVGTGETQPVRQDARNLEPGEEEVDRTIAVALEDARAEAEPERRLQQILEAVNNWVLNWRRPSGALRTAP